MRRLVCAVLAVMVVGSLALPSRLVAQQKRVVTIASGWVVGVYYPLAGAMSRIAYNAPALNLRVTVESSGASVANAQLLGGREVDFAILQNDVAYYAYTGSVLPPFKGKPVKNMGGVFAIYPEIVHVAATHAAAIKSVRDLRGKRVVLGPPGSGTEQNALQTLEAHGLREGDLARAERMDAVSAADALKSELVDAAFFTTGIGSAVMVDAFVAGKLVLVPVAAAEADAIKKKYPFYTLELVPAGTYRGQEADVPQLAVRAMMVARTDVPDELVYSFTKAIFDNLPQFYDAHPAAKNLVLATALNGMPIPLHPGAARLYRERGVAK